MGLNFVIACHRCRERHYMMRGDEARDLQAFWRRHFSCSEADPKFMELFCDKDDLPDYHDPHSEFWTRMTTPVSVAGRHGDTLSE